MADDHRELIRKVRRIACVAKRRGHAAYFHANSQDQPAAEVAYVQEWETAMNEFHGWNIRNVRKNPGTYPDCMADFGPEGARNPDIVGVEVTELVCQDAIDAHQEWPRLEKVGRLEQIGTSALLNLSRRMNPEWPLDKFRERLRERVHDKDRRSRDRSLKMQFLLVLTDEDALKDTLAQYLEEVFLPPPRTFDAVYLMLPYETRGGHGGHYPVFEVPVSGA